ALGARKLRILDSKQTSETWAAAAPRLPKSVVSRTTHKEPGLLSDAFLSAVAPPPLAGAAGARGQQAQHGEDRGQQDAAGEAPHRCATCGAAFRRAALLQAHIRTHAADKLDSGEHCSDSSSADNADLRRHAGTHTDDRPFRCLTCGKGFTRSTILRKHMMTHTGEKPYKCRTCGKRFAHYTSLRGHMMTHTGEKPFSCQTCGKHFSESSNLRKHVAAHEPRTAAAARHPKRAVRSKTHEPGPQDHVSLAAAEPPPAGAAGARGKEAQDGEDRGQKDAAGEASEAPHRCATCGAGFRRAALLRAHMRTHATGTAPEPRTSELKGTSGTNP
ncbi:gastrula zinc finger protein XlCGF7.1-like, partial [Frankliniella occidentalis]|uniref:Gastrula zinc finger protein XlCGF7.1-like n=1 Tax=Frankliniella occidentalis TaxID=133901 RepID=A0A9C6XUB9_FRAOC